MSEATEAKPLNIYQRINEIKKVKEVEFATKDQNQGSYKTLSHDKVTALLRDAMVEHGVISTISLESTETRELPSQKLYFLVENIWLIRFINIDQPDDYIEVRMPSQVFTNNDKGSGTSCSYAMKYGMLKVFGIVTGENEESTVELFRYNKEASELKQTERLAKIRKRLEAANTEEAVLCQYVTQDERKNTLEQLNQAQIKACEDALVKKERKIAAKNNGAQNG